MKQVKILNRVKVGERVRIHYEDRDHYAEGCEGVVLETSPMGYTMVEVDKRPAGTTCKIVLVHPEGVNKI